MGHHHVHGAHDYHHDVEEKQDFFIYPLEQGARHQRRLWSTPLPVIYI